MSESLEITLHNRQQAWAAIKAQVFPFLKQWLSDGRQLVLTCKLRTRTTKQNKRYWSRGVLAQIAEQAVVNGKQYDAEVWHEQFKRQFIGVEELPDGSVRGKSSAKLTTAQFGEFCAQVEAFAASELSVVFYDLETHT